MIRYNEIRAVFTEKLAKHLGLKVINMNGGGKMPSTAFFTYSFSPGFGDPRGFPVYSEEDDRLVQRETVLFTVSFLSYADDNAASTYNALRAQDWFKTAGHDYLKELDVVVVNIGSIDNRDVLIGDEWERRTGFDVDFRTASVADQPLDWIEKANIKFTGS